ncbi:MAG: hypothetical protein PHE79_11830 [Eubacteriales bacterium]|nr:hypothetical protein [Eubacteriales bacterium]
MYAYIEPYSLKETIVNTDIKGTAVDVAIKGRKFMLHNTGAQPLYFKEKNGVAATTTNANICAAGTVYPIAMVADTLSLISNATGTSYTIQILDI